MANVPTVGRKLHFFPVNDPGVQKFDDQPIDATIIYVWPKANEAHLQTVNLLVVDHAGTVQTKTSVPVVNEGDEIPQHSFYARWPAIMTAQSVAPAAEPIPATSDASVSLPETPAPTAEAAESQNADANAPAPEIAPTAEVEKPVTYGFDEALKALKAGKAATRKAWGPNVFIYHVPAASYKAQTGIAKKVFGEDALVPYMAYLAIKRADGQVCVFNPGVDSILAEDWEISQ